MSLKEEIVLDEIAETLVTKAWGLADATLELWRKVNRRKQLPKSLLKKIKKLAQEINEICEELP